MFKITRSPENSPPAPVWPAGDRQAPDGKQTLLLQSGEHLEHLAIAPLADISKLCQEEARQMVTGFLQYVLGSFLSDTKLGRSFVLHGGAALGIYLRPLRVQFEGMKNHSDLLRKLHNTLPTSLNKCYDFDLSTNEQQSHIEGLLNLFRLATESMLNDKSLSFVISEITPITEIYRGAGLMNGEKAKGVCLETARCQTLSIDFSGQLLLKIDVTFAPDQDLGQYTQCSRPYDNEGALMDVYFGCYSRTISVCTLPKLVNNLQVAFINTYRQTGINGNKFWQRLSLLQQLSQQGHLNYDQNILQGIIEYFAGQCPTLVFKAITAEQSTQTGIHFRTCSPTTDQGPLAVKNSSIKKNICARSIGAMAAMPEPVRRCQSSQRDNETQTSNKPNHKNNKMDNRALSNLYQRDKSTNTTAVETHSKSQQTEIMLIARQGSRDEICNRLSRMTCKLKQFQALLKSKGRNGYSHQVNVNKLMDEVVSLDQQYKTIKKQDGGTLRLNPPKVLKVILKQIDDVTIQFYQCLNVAIGVKTINEKLNIYIAITALMNMKRRVALDLINRSNQSVTEIDREYLSFAIEFFSSIINFFKACPECGFPDSALTTKLIPSLTEEIYPIIKEILYRKGKAAAELRTEYYLILVKLKAALSWVTPQRYPDITLTHFHLRSTYPDYSEKFSIGSLSAECNSVECQLQAIIEPVPYFDTMNQLCDWLQEIQELEFAAIFVIHHLRFICQESKPRYGDLAIEHFFCSVDSQVRIRQLYDSLTCDTGLILFRQEGLDECRARTQLQSLLKTRIEECVSYFSESRKINLQHLDISDPQLADRLNYWNNKEFTDWPSYLSQWCTIL